MNAVSLLVVTSHVLDREIYVCRTTRGHNSTGSILVVYYTTPTHAYYNFH
jgi:hypothetical protein